MRRVINAFIVMLLLTVASHAATYTFYVDPNSAGGDGTTTALSGANAAYVSMSACEDAQDGIARNSGDVVQCVGLRQGANIDTVPLVVADWPAGVIPVFTVDPAYRHQGKWADRRDGGSGNYIYILKRTLEATDNAVVTALSDFTVVSWFEIDMEAAGTFYDNFRGVFVDSVSNTVIEGNVIRMSGTAGTSSDGFAGIRLRHTTTGTRTYTIRNNIIYGLRANGGTAFSGIWADFGSNYGTKTVNISNNTIINCDRGLHYNIRNTNSTYEYNNAVLNCTSCFYQDTYVPTFIARVGNVSSDATATGTSYAINKTDYNAYFKGEFDYHLTASSAQLWGLTGSDQSAVFTTDIDGETRAGAFGVGADWVENDVTQLTVPTLSSPSDSATGVSLSTSLLWDDTNTSPNESSVYIRIKAGSGEYQYYSAAADSTSVSAATAFGSALSNSTTYSWSVQAKGDGSTTSDSDWPTDRTFTTVVASAPVSPSGRLRLRGN